MGEPSTAAGEVAGNSAIVKADIDEKVACRIEAGVALAISKARFDSFVVSLQEVASVNCYF